MADIDLTGTVEVTADTTQAERQIAKLDGAAVGRENVPITPLRSLADAVAKARASGSGAGAGIGGGAVTGGAARVGQGGAGGGAGGAAASVLARVAVTGFVVVGVLAAMAAAAKKVNEKFKESIDRIGASSGPLAAAMNRERLARKAIDRELGANLLPSFRKLSDEQVRFARNFAPAEQAFDELVAGVKTFAFRGLNELAEGFTALLRKLGVEVDTFGGRVGFNAFAGIANIISPQQQRGLSDEGRELAKRMADFVIAREMANKEAMRQRMIDAARSAREASRPRGSFQFRPERNPFMPGGRFNPLPDDLPNPR